MESDIKNVNLSFLDISFGESNVMVLEDDCGTETARERVPTISCCAGNRAEESHGL